MLSAAADLPNFFSAESLLSQINLLRGRPVHCAEGVKVRARLLVDGRGHGGHVARPAQGGVAAARLVQVDALRTRRRGVVQGLLHGRVSISQSVYVVIFELRKHRMF